MKNRPSGHRRLYAYRVQVGADAGVVRAVSMMDAARKYARIKWLGPNWAVMVSTQPEPGTEPLMETFITTWKPNGIPDVRVP